MNRLLVIAASGAMMLLAACGSTVTKAPSAPGRTASSAHATATAKPKPRQHLIATFVGNGDTNTRRFRTPSTWFVRYRYNCSGFGQSGNFIVNENGSLTDTNVSVNGLAKTGHGRSYAHFDPGRHFLGILSECSWKIRVYG